MEVGSRGILFILVLICTYQFLRPFGNFSFALCDLFIKGILGEKKNKKNRGTQFAAGQ